LGIFRRASFTNSREPGGDHGPLALVEVASVEVPGEDVVARRAGPVPVHVVWEDSEFLTGPGTVTTIEDLVLVEGDRLEQTTSNGDALLEPLEILLAHRWEGQREFVDFMTTDHRTNSGRSSLRVVSFVVGIGFDRFGRGGCGIRRVLDHGSGVG
jgi:hypothetical protein